jgi:hypothetical protein
MGIAATSIWIGEQKRWHAALSSGLLMDSQSCRLYLEYIWVCLKIYINYWNTTQNGNFKEESSEHHEILV